jgi:hypothetical protein
VEVADEWERMLDRMAAGATPASVDLFAPYLLAEPCTLSDYFAPGDLLVVDEPSAVRLAAAQLAAQAAELEAGSSPTGNCRRSALPDRRMGGDRTAAGAPGPARPRDRARR